MIATKAIFYFFDSLCNFFNEDIITFETGYESESILIKKTANEDVFCIQSNALSANAVLNCLNPFQTWVQMYPQKMLKVLVFETTKKQ